jgi:hypothetical protein
LPVDCRRKRKRINAMRNKLRQFTFALIFKRSFKFFDGIA